jgi:hypothetical protein
VGNYLLNFSTLDYLVFVFLKDRLTPSDFDKVKGWHFHDRLDRISQYLADTKSSPEKLA